MFTAVGREGRSSEEWKEILPAPVWQHARVSQIKGSAWSSSEITSLLESTDEQTLLSGEHFREASSEGSSMSETQRFWRRLALFSPLIFAPSVKEPPPINPFISCLFLYLRHVFSHHSWAIETAPWQVKRILPLTKSKTESPEDVMQRLLLLLFSGHFCVNLQLSSVDVAEAEILSFFI